MCRAAAEALKAPGCFVFTTEALAEPTRVDVQIRPTGRYAHGRDHLTRSLCAAGFAQVEAERVILRQEAGQPMPGWLATARTGPAEPEPRRP